MEDLMQKITSLAKRRGFIFQSSEIYGGFGSCYDFGPLGVEMKNNLKMAWWKSMVSAHDNIVGLDASILMSPKVWEASGHLSAGFADELVECKKCHKRFRIEDLEKTQSANRKSQNHSAKVKADSKCLDCGGDLAKPRKFNLMMKTFVGPVEDDAAVAYLRAETCQGIYVNFQNVMQSMRLKPPFGIAQIGKSFRNEITPKDFIYRTREFEQMEMQFFVRPKADKKPLIDTNKNTNQHEWGPDEWFEYWKQERMQWYLNLGLKKENLRFREHEKDELAHYAKKAVDIEYQFPFGWKEVEGIHDRGDWDLSNHSKHSGKDLSYQDPSAGPGQAKEKYTPHVIETSGGADRSFLAFLLDAYDEIKGARTTTTEAAKETEVVLRLHESLAPVKVAVLPLVKNKEELVGKAKEIRDMLKPHFAVQYDEVGSIGRRYRRQDEIGTPLCVTVDFDSVKNGDATVRDRDNMKQERVKIEDLKSTIDRFLEMC